MTDDEHPFFADIIQAFEKLGNATPAEAAFEELGHLMDENEILFHRNTSVSQNKSWALALRRGLMSLGHNPMMAAETIFFFHRFHGNEDYEFMEPLKQTLLFSQILRRSILVTEDVDSRRKMAFHWKKCVLKMSSINPPLANVLIDQTLSECVEWVCIGSPHQYMAGCVIAEQVSEVSTAAVEKHARHFIQGVWVGLCDSTDDMRTMGGSLLRAVLNAEPAYIVEVLQVIELFERRIRTHTSVHAALIGLGSILKVMDCHSFQLHHSHWHFVLDQLVTSHKASSLPVFVEATRLLPLLAKNSKATFDLFVVRILEIIRNVFNHHRMFDEKAELFLAIGKLAELVPERVDDFALNVTFFMEKTLAAKHGDRWDAAAVCLAQLSKAKRGVMRSHMIRMMQSLFVGVYVPTNSFATTVQVLCSCFPELSTECLERMLDRLSGSLAATAPTSEILTALEALRELNFDRYPLHTFLEKQVVPHLKSSSQAVRLGAVRTCAKLIFSGCLVKDAGCEQDSSGAILHHGKDHIESIIRLQRCLIDVAVADSKGSVRLETIRSFSPLFDLTLACHEPCRSLFPTLNDKPVNRQAALSLLGRLAKRNPAYILPMLRRVLVQSSVELHYFDKPQRQSSTFQVVEALGLLAETTPALVAPYATNLLDILVRTIDETIQLHPALLVAIGRLLLHVAPEDVTHYHWLQTRFIEYIEKSHDKELRRESIRALTAFVRASGNISMYSDFPTLFPSLCALLHGGFKESFAIRHDVLALMGAIGAVDPSVINAVDKRRVEAEAAFSPRGTTHQQAVLSALIIVLVNSEEESCGKAADALASIITLTQMSMQSTIDNMHRMVGPCLNRIRKSTSDVRVVILQALEKLVRKLRNNVRIFAVEIFETSCEMLPCRDVPVSSAAVRLIAALRSSLQEEFRPFVGVALPVLLSLPQDEVTLVCLGSFGSLLDDHIHHVLPYMLEGSMNRDCKVAICALHQLDDMIRELPSVALHSTRIVHCLRFVSNPDGVCTAASRVLDSLRGQMNSGFSKYDMYFATKKLHNIEHGQVEPLAEPSRRALEHLVPRTEKLMRVVSEGPSITEESGSNWLRSLCIELLTNSPVRDFTLCVPLAESHFAFARTLFRQAFGAMHAVLRTNAHDLVNNLESTLQNRNAPSEVVLELLNLAEYMECTSPTVGCLFDPQVLMERSEQCSLYAKALHYAEIQFTRLTTEFELSQSNGSGDLRVNADRWRELLTCSEKLISLCNQLGLKESAEAVLRYLIRNFSSMTGEKGSLHAPNIEIYAKLRWWRESFAAYKQKHLQHPTCVEYMVGMLTALDAEGDVQGVFDAWSDFERRLSGPTQQHREGLSRVSQFGAHASWLLQKWDCLSLCLKNMDDDSPESAFYGAMLALRTGQRDQTQQLICECRKKLDTRVSSLVTESYERAYHHVVSLQQLSELEEVARLGDAAAFERVRISELWRKRLYSMEASPSKWQGTLANHSLVLSPNENVESWLRFVTICKRSNNVPMAHSALERLLRANGTTLDSFITNPTASVPPGLSLSVAEFVRMRVDGNDLGLNLLRRYVSEIEEIGVERFDSMPLSRCYSALAQWVSEGARRPQLTEARMIINRALSLSSCDVEAWRTCARIDQRLARGSIAAEVPLFTRSAAENYLRCSSSGAMQDLLGLLSLWFSRSTKWTNPPIDEVVENDVDRVPVAAWIPVVPQIVARINSPSQTAIRAVRVLLRRIAVAFPQALLYALHVHVNASTEAQDIKNRRVAALEILEFIRTGCGEHGADLVTHAGGLCRELIRCALTMTEVWMTELEELVATHTGVTLAQKLESMIDVEATTAPDKACIKDFASDIRLAAEYFRTGKWDLGRSTLEYVSGRMNDQLQMLTSLDLAYVSPELDGMDSLRVAVPGTFTAVHDDFPRVHSVRSTLKVMSSKQRPRCVRMCGSDGKEYKFLLKGHEDMRQDERVMQLLSFVSTLLSTNEQPTLARRECLPVTYAVVPLSDNVGLAGWVSHADTLNDIVCSNREVTMRSKTEENELVNKISPLSTFNFLSAVQKLECYSFAVFRTPGNDIARAMWSRAVGAEVWLHRRTTFVRTLATMSAVGYILGLGDRHPNNLMLNSITGQVVHIDFGDCFEVAIERPNLPETVPFRLTRMLVNAMEIGGIDGDFSHTTVGVMRLMRDERDNLMSLLETFVDDPLISWRLLDKDGGAARPPAQSDNSTFPTSSIRPVTEINASMQMNPSMRYHLRSSIARAAQKSPGAYVHRAHRVVNRIREKLCGTEDKHYPPRPRSQAHLTGKPESVSCQVDRLIAQATSPELLSQCYIGWQPMW